MLLEPVSAGRGTILRHGDRRREVLDGATLVAAEVAHATIGGRRRAHEVGFNRRPGLRSLVSARRAREDTNSGPASHPRHDPLREDMP